MRLFVGIELPAEVRAAAGSVAEDVRLRLRRSRTRVDARWVSTDNLHITLWFIGEVDDNRASTLARALEKPFRTPAFDLEIAGCGAFPQSGTPRTLWLAVERGGESLRALHSEVGERLLPLGFEAERRPYAAHLTIARIKEIRAADRKGIRSVLSNMAGEIGTCRIEAVTLFRSRLSPKGSQYEPLLRAPLM